MKSAVAYLDRYASSSANLRSVLARKVMRAAKALDKDPSDYDKAIDAVVAKCQRNGLVDDARYAEIKTASGRRKGQSRRKIEAHLQAKGIDRDTIDHVLANHDGSDADAAMTFARKRRLGPWRTRGDRSERRDRDLAAMCRAGFSFDLARKVIDGDAPDEMV